MGLTGSSIHRAAVRLAAVCGLVLLSTSAGSGRATAVGPEPTVQVSQGPLMRLDLEVVLGGFSGPIQREAAALATLALADDLASVPSLVPIIQGVPLSPATEALRDWAPRSTAVTLTADGPSLRLEACAERCVELTAPTASPTAAAAQLRAGLCAALGIEDPVELAPLVPDPYIRRVLGRSASVVLGWTAAPTPAERERRRANPALRAVFLDATVPLSRAMLGTARTQWGDRIGAAEAFSAAASLEPSPHRLASAALAWGAAGERERAERAWLAIPQDVQDERVAVLRAQALTETQPAAGLALLDAAPAFRGLAPFHRTRADLLAALGDPAEEEAALLRWAAVAPSDPAPERRRLTLLLGQSRLEEAALAAESLAARDPEGADAIRLAVALALDPSRAAELATQLPDAEASAAILARAAADTDDAAPTDDTSWSEPPPVPVLDASR